MVYHLSHGVEGSGNPSTWGSPRKGTCRAEDPQGVPLRGEGPLPRPPGEGGRKARPRPRQPGAEGLSRGLPPALQADRGTLRRNHEEGAHERANPFRLLFERGPDPRLLTKGHQRGLQGGKEDPRIRDDPPPGECDPARGGRENPREPPSRNPPGRKAAHQRDALRYS